MNTGRQQLTSQEISLTFQVCFLVFLVLREGEEKKKKWIPSIPSNVARKQQLKHL